MPVNPQRKELFLKDQILSFKSGPHLEGCLDCSGTQKLSPFEKVVESMVLNRFTCKIEKYIYKVVSVAPVIAEIFG